MAKFDEKCKCCEREMAEVSEEFTNSVGSYLTYHCSFCGTYLRYYDCYKPADDEWIIPELAKKMINKTG